MSPPDDADVYAETLGVFDRRGNPHEPLTATEVAEALGCVRRTAYKRLDRLSERGDLETKKVGARGRVWWRTPDVRGGRSPGGRATPGRPDPDGDREGTGNDADRRESGRPPDTAERFYRTLVEHFPDGSVAAFDDDLRYVFVEGPAFDGVPAAGDLEGRRVGETAKADTERLEDHYRAALSGETRTFEFEWEDGIRRVWVFPVTDGNGEVLAGMVMTRDVTERRRRERRPRARRRKLAVLDDLNRVVRNVTRTVVRQSTRDAIEDVVRERIAGSDPYLSARIDRVDRPHGGTAGDGGTESIGTATPEMGGAAARALETLEPQVIDGAVEDVASDHRREESDGTPRSAIAIPITFERRVFGVLTVWTERVDAFDEREYAVIGHLGEIIGHAITSLERKQGLMDERVLEVTLRSRMLGRPYVEAADGDPISVSIDGMIPLEDGDILQYFTVDEPTPGTFYDAIEEFPADIDVRALGRSGGASRFEIRVSGPTATSTMANYGGHIRSAELEDGAMQIVVELPLGTDLRGLEKGVRKTYPDMEVVAKKRRSRTRPTERGRLGSLENDLTDRQGTVLELAHHAGYFEWPRRESTAEDLAERMDLAPQTLHEHLRKAERKLVEALFADDLDGIRGGRPGSDPV